MSDIKELLKINRPTLSASSVKTYDSIIRSLHNKVFNTKNVDVNNFNDVERVLNYLSDVPSSKRKTILSALFVLNGKEEYRVAMSEDIREYDEEISKQEKTESQRENWITSEEINEMLNEFEMKSKAIYKKDEKTIADLRTVRNYVILCLLSGKFIQPRRSLDYVNFKIRDINRETDNYLDKNELVFNSYKTSKTYGRQTLKIPTKLKNILLKWIAINPTDYLLFDSNLNQMSSVKLNQTLNKLFGKRISVNALRHSYLTEKYAETSRQTKELENDMKAMGSSKNVAVNYIKLD